MSKAGYEGKDAMREKAQKLFGPDATTNMEVTPSRSTPAKTPMRMYAKGGSVKCASGGSMMPKISKPSKAPAEVQGGTLTDLKMPKAMPRSQYKQGGAVKKAAGGSMNKTSISDPASYIQKSIHKGLSGGSAHAHDELDIEQHRGEMKKGGAVKSVTGKTRAKVTSDVRRAIKGRTKAVADAGTKKSATLEGVDMKNMKPAMKRGGKVKK